jgi:hypothetical protein
MRGSEGRTHGPGSRETEDKNFHWDGVGLMKKFGAHDCDEEAFSHRDSLQTTD